MRRTYKYKCVFICSLHVSGQFHIRKLFNNNLVKDSFNDHKWCLCVCMCLKSCRRRKLVSKRRDINVCVLAVLSCFTIFPLIQLEFHIDIDFGKNYVCFILYVQVDIHIQCAICTALCFCDCYLYTLCRYGSLIQSPFHML